MILYSLSSTWMSLIKKCPHCHCPGLNPVHLHGTLSGPVYKINTLRHTLLVLVIHFWLKSSVCQCEGLWLLSPVTPELRPSWRLMLSWPLGRWCTDQPHSRQEVSVTKHLLLDSFLQGVPTSPQILRYLMNVWLVSQKPCNPWCSPVW